ncbi:hypothetical protein AAHN97_15070 [Chitinophaga niabensis]|uniref:hypothetical protein n=1 Tax=Chitinophaga niabensis TaxID=536979 RepID=UPI0031BA5B54
MTREEQIKLASARWAEGNTDRIATQFIQGALWADANRWVKVGEAEPEYGVLYDIVIDGFTSGIGIYNGKKWFGKTWGWDFLKEHDTVTHFAIRSPLPLPEPPKAEQ